MAFSPFMWKNDLQLDAHSFISKYTYIVKPTNKDMQTAGGIRKTGAIVLKVFFDVRNSDFLFFYFFFAFFFYFPNDGGQFFAFERFNKKLIQKRDDRMPWEAEMFNWKFTCLHHPPFRKEPITYLKKKIDK